MAMCKESIGDESEVDVINISFDWRCVFGCYEVHRCRLQLNKREEAKYSCYQLHRHWNSLHQNTHLVETLLSSHGTGRGCPPFFNLCDQSFIHTPARKAEIPGKSQTHILKQLHLLYNSNSIQMLPPSGNRSYYIAH